MDKTEELKHVHAVYGAGRVFDPVTRDPPDFASRRNGRLTLGVEVSELFANESDARLKKVSGYALDLLAGGDYLHKDDRAHLKVAPATIMDKDGVVKAEVMAIMQQVPAFPLRVALLCELVRGKTRALENYAKRWLAVDLVVADMSNLFTFNEYKEFFQPFSHFVDRELLTRSKFREIYMLVSSKEQRLVIPVKLNLFAEDAFILEELISQECGAEQGGESRDVFRMLCYCLAATGYGAFHAVTVDGCTGFAVGAHLYLYGSESKVVRDYTTIPEQLPIGVPMHKLARGLEGTDLAIAQRVLGRRRELTCSVALCYPAKSGAGK
jgi:hypothetical protein